MKNNFFTLFLIFIFSSWLNAQEVFIEAENITLDKKKQVSIFENKVIITTEKNNIIKGDYAEYDKDKKFIIIRNNVSVEDDKKNIIKTNEATYDEKTKIFKSIGSTTITTTDGYELVGANINLNNSDRIIISNSNSEIKDRNNNKILLDNFEYLIDKNIFKSIGKIMVKDTSSNIYEFSQIYIDTKEKKILGTDIKAKIDQNNFKVDERNKPRIFANTAEVSKEKSSFTKSIFTLCDYRENDKCPPWSIQASKMLHDNKKKTIYYDNAVIKIYDIPIFYSPKLSHPDPSVKRRSGFLVPSFQNAKNLGQGISILYARENALILGQYNQAFKNSKFLADFGYTQGYKKTTSKKKPGEKSHFFSKFTKNFTGKDGSLNSLAINTQDISNDKYLKLYKIKSNLADYNTDTLKNTLDFTREKDDLFIGFNTSIYETLDESYNDKYEYIFPDITVDKNLFNNSLGFTNLQSNFKVHSYDTNKLKSYFINDFNFNSYNHNLGPIVKGELLGNLKNINYETKNVNNFKEDLTSEIFGSLGYLSKIDLFKKNNEARHLLTPKLFLRYAPGSMRKEENGSRLTAKNAFNLNRMDNIDNYETGMSGTFGFDYKLDKNNNNFDFSVAQIINDKANKKRHSKTSQDEKLSDLVGSATFSMNNKTNINYNFAIDQNYKDLNYNELGLNLNLDPVQINFDYLKEYKHIGDQEYFKTKIDFINKNNNVASVGTKRNLITNSAEYYDLSYEYINDCLRAGLVYRREFYNDSELEPENSLMFKITLTPFGNITSPSFSK
jgi:LPS-assembly protein